MGGLTPIVTQAATTLAGPVFGSALTPLIIGGVTGALKANQAYRSQEQEQELALEQLRQRQKLEQRQLATQTALDREKLKVETEAAEEKRRAALRRAVARQRAQFGSSGIGNSGSGSSQAVLLGLFEETESELESRARLDSLRSRALDLNVSNRNSLNVLQRTQLQERQRLDRVSGGRLF